MLNQEPKGRKIKPPFVRFLSISDAVHTLPPFPTLIQFKFTGEQGGNNLGKPPEAMSDVQKVGEVFSAAGTAFSRLAEITASMNIGEGAVNGYVLWQCSVHCEHSEG